jgi:hypothetical protein
MALAYAGARPVAGRNSSRRAIFTSDGAPAAPDNPYFDNTGGGVAADITVRCTHNFNAPYPAGLQVTFSEFSEIPLRMWAVANVAGDNAIDVTMQDVPPGVALECTVFVDKLY